MPMQSLLVKKKPLTANYLPVLLSGILSGMLLLTFGCKRESPPAPGDPNEKTPTPKADTQSRAPNATRMGTNATLQAAIDSLADLHLEANPGKRSLPVSDAAVTPYEWAVKALRQGYQNCGNTNAQWDAAAAEALGAYCDYTRNLRAGRYGSITGAVARARSAGCNDPMLEYLFVRYCKGPHNQSDGTYAVALVNACSKLGPTRYHPAFKATAGLRAMEAARAADPKGGRGSLQHFVNVFLQDFARDSNAPPAEIFKATFEWVDWTKAKGWIDFVMKDLDPILQKTWPDEAALYELRGEAEMQRGWEERGGSWANTVSEQGWEGFRTHMDMAEKYLTKSWSMNPSNASTGYRMMQCELGQGKGRGRMQQWFARTMTLSTNNFDAVKLMSFYLEPRWYGSEQETLAFARSCVTNQEWGGTVPLILPNVHHSLATYIKQNDSPEYWHRPEVWRDIKASYERFFELNPTEVGWGHDYSRDAYLCGQYGPFLAQTKLFNNWTNYQFFGGRERFEQMVHTAGVEAAGQTPN